MRAFAEDFCFTEAHRPRIFSPPFFGSVPRFFGGAFPHRRPRGGLAPDLTLGMEFGKPWKASNLRERSKIRFPGPRPGPHKS